MPRGLFVSDLHLFARRSLGLSEVAQFDRLAASADYFVFGGDIFDFTWSRLPSQSATATAAAEWLEARMAAAPNCRFDYLLGNHDHHELFLAHLERLSHQYENFHWDPYLLRRDNQVFLHGDVADGHVTPERLEASRKKRLKHRTMPRLLDSVYDAAILARAHTVTAKVFHPHRRVAKRILSYLERLEMTPGTGVTDVYFGHTHVGMDNFDFQGVRFHNGGAPIRGVPFRVVAIP